MTRLHYNVDDCVEALRVAHELATRSAKAGSSVPYAEHYLNSLHRYCSYEIQKNTIGIIQNIRLHLKVAPWSTHTVVISAPGRDCQWLILDQRPDGTTTSTEKEDFNYAMSYLLLEAYPSTAIQPMRNYQDTDTLLHLLT